MPSQALGVRYETARDPRAPSARPLCMGMAGGGASCVGCLMLRIVPRGRRGGAQQGQYRHRDCCCRERGHDQRREAPMQRESRLPVFWVQDTPTLHRCGGSGLKIVVEKFAHMR